MSAPKFHGESRAPYLDGDPAAFDAPVADVHEEQGGGLAEDMELELAPRVVPVVPPRTAEKILKAAWDLSFVQALQPDIEDETGFNNADYKLGGIMAMSQDVRGSALMLIRYPAQYPGYGLEIDDLRWALPKEADGLPVRMAAAQALAEIREANRNRVAWAEKGDVVVLVGNGIATADKQLLRTLGTETKTSFEIPKSRLDLFLSLVSANVVERETLAAIASNVVQEKSMATDGGKVIGKPRVTAVPTKTGFAVNWSDPFSADGQSIKKAVQDVGGRWDGGTRTWAVPERGVKMLAVVLEDAPFADISALPIKPEQVPGELRAEAEQVMSGITPIKVNGMSPDGVRFVTVQRSDALYQVCREAGVKWDGIGKQYVAKPEQLPRLLSLLDGEDNLDASKLVVAAMELAGKLVAQEQRRANIEQVVGSSVVPTETPTGRTMKGYQPEGVKFFCTCGPATQTKGGIEADDMGLGKCLMAIVGADRRLPDGKKIVMCPSSLKGNWHAEIEKWLGKEEAATAQVIKDGKTVVDMSKKWLIINYDLVAKKYAELIDFGADILIMDEAHEVTNRKSQRGEAIYGLKKKDNNTGKWTIKPGIIDNIPLRFPMSGTEIKNRVMDVYSLLVLIDHPLTWEHSRHPLRDTYPEEKSAVMKFGRHFCAGKQEQIDKAGRMAWNFDGKSNLDQLGEMMKSSYIKRFKKDVLELGEKVEIPFKIQLAPDQIKEYNKLLKELLANHRGEDGLPSGEQRGAALRAMTAMKKATALAKVDATFERIKCAVEGGEKVVVFSLYLDVLDGLEAKVKAYLKERGQKYLRLDGSVPSDKRYPMQDEFQNNPDVMVWLGQSKASGVGLTLTAATVVIHNDVWWNPFMIDQATDRIYRIGQESPIMVYYMMAEGTFDEPLYAIVGGKREDIADFQEATDNTEAANVGEESGKGVENVMAMVYRDILKEARRMERTEKKAKKGKP